MFKESLEKIIESWIKQKLTLARPLSESEIVKSFSDFGVKISKDFIGIFSNFGGFEDDDLDDEFFTFWTVEKILQENKQNAEFVNFADFLLYSHYYAFKFENDDKSSICAVFGDNDKIKVADSFSEFFDFYLNYIKRLFP